MITSLLKNNPGTAPRFLLFSRCLGLALFLNGLHLLPYLSECLTTAGFHPSPPALGAVGRFSLTPFSSFVLLAPSVAIFFGSCLLLICDKARRISAFLAAGGLAGFLWIDPASSAAHLKIALLALLLIATVSVRDLKGNWSLWLGRFFLVSIYFLAGWRKAVLGGWLEGASPLVDILEGSFATPLSLWLVPLLPVKVLTAASLFVVGFQLLAPFLFLNRITRNFALVCGLTFHLAIALLMKDMLFFSVVMLSFYPLFLPESALAALKHAFGRFKGKREP